MKTNIYVVMREEISNYYIPMAAFRYRKKADEYVTKGIKTDTDSSGNPYQYRVWVVELEDDSPEPARDVQDI